MRLRLGPPAWPNGSIGDTAPDPAQLRGALVARLRGLGAFKTPAVEAAFQAVPRRLFLAGANLDSPTRPRWS